MLLSSPFLLVFPLLTPMVHCNAETGNHLTVAQVRGIRRETDNQSFIAFLSVSQDSPDILAAGEDQDEARVEAEMDADVDSASGPVFVPTDDWQEVRPGQVVPAGLHVRINLQTGKKEAKKLSPEEQVGVKPGNVSGTKEEEQKQSIGERGGHSPSLLQIYQYLIVGKIDDGGSGGSQIGEGLRSYQVFLATAHTNAGINFILTPGASAAEGAKRHQVQLRI